MMAELSVSAKTGFFSSKDLNATPQETAPKNCKSVNMRSRECDTRRLGLCCFHEEVKMPLIRHSVLKGWQKRLSYNELRVATRNLPQVLWEEGFEVVVKEVLENGTAVAGEAGQDSRTRHG